MAVRSISHRQHRNLSAYWPGAFPVGQETGAALAGGAAVQGLGRSGAVTPGGNMNSATGVTGPPPARPAPPRPVGDGGGGMVAAEQRGTIWSALAREYKVSASSTAASRMSGS